MRYAVTPLVLFLALLGAAGIGSAQGRSAMDDELARQAVEKFFNAFEAGDHEALMKTTDVPFCREGGRNIEKREDLKPFLHKVLDRRDPSTDQMRITLVTTLP